MIIKHFLRKTVLVFILMVLFLLIMGMSVLLLWFSSSSKHMGMAVEAIDNMAEGNFSYRIDKVTVIGKK